jgi:hypothetical protein
VSWQDQGMMRMEIVLLMVKLVCPICDREAAGMS